MPVADELEKQLLEDMRGKLPEKLCPAHNSLMLYIINTNKEMKIIKKDNAETNGNVKKLMDYIIKDEAVEEYKKQNKLFNFSNKSNLIAIASTIIAAISLVGYIYTIFFK